MGGTRSLKVPSSPEGSYSLSVWTNHARPGSNATNAGSSRFWCTDKRRPYLLTCRAARTLEMQKYQSGCRRDGGSAGRSI